MSYKIKDLPIEEKPREKAKLKGITSLTIPELIAIILRTGNNDESVKDLSIRLYNQIGGLNGLTKLRLNNLTNIKGIGEAKAITLIASLELGKRVILHKTNEKKKIKSTVDVYNYYHDYFYLEEQEKFLCLFLDSKNYVINEKVIFIGTANQSIVHPRDIFKEAILNNAVKIICLHNHPSGDETPSKEDISFTKKLKNAGEILGIPLLDHVVIGRNTYYSFLDRGSL